MRAVQVAHFDTIRLRVGPVKFPAQPIAGETVRRDETRRDDIDTQVGSIQPRLLYHLEGDVRPEEKVLVVDEVETGGVLEAADDDRRVAARTARVDESDVAPVRK